MSTILLELRAKLAAVTTSGPWWIKRGSTNDRPGRLMGTAEKGTPMEHAVEINPKSPPNADLIAAAITALPALLDVAELVEAEHFRVRWLDADYAPQFTYERDPDGPGCVCRFTGCPYLAMIEKLPQDLQA
jgi:hypothetical protein